VLAPRHRQTARWSLRLENPAPSIVHTRGEGHADLACVKEFWDYFESVARTQSPIENFHDWANLAGYDAEVRQRYTQWARAHRAEIKAATILVSSRLVAMGVTVANLALGHLTAHHDRGKFERALEEAVARANTARR
jgi:hypothetical protein